MEEIPAKDLFVQEEVASKLKALHPMEIISWGVETLGAEHLTLACSFGYEDVALVDMVFKVDQAINIFYIDTDLLFPETYRVRDQLQQKYNCLFQAIKPQLTLKEQREQYGDQLWKHDPDQCCSLRKVIPLQSVLTNYKGWITGIRRQQSSTRANAEVVEWDSLFGLWKFNPLAYWSDQQVWVYIREHQLPYNPLHDQHYPSIGCYPCTQPVQPGENPRAGRWKGFAKEECGLHLQSKKKE